MKITNIIAPCLAVLVSVLAPFSNARAQGSLNPPAGVPVPTMKSLAQIEPRTPISTLPFTISSSGSYYVTTNLTGTFAQHGIIIASGSVTLDLSGFTLTGTAVALSGIYISGSYTNVTVRNGAVSGWPNGVDGLTAGKTRNAVYENLTVSFNAGAGIEVEDTSVVRDCLAIGNGLVGINSAGGQILRCVCRNNGGQGIGATNCSVSGCQTEFNNYGIVATNSTVRDCMSQNNTVDGIDIAGGEVRDCMVDNNSVSGGGISAIQSRVIDCVIRLNGTGILMADSEARNCEVSYNKNDGIDSFPGLFNKNEVRDCRIFDNTGTGISFTSGAGTATGNYIALNSMFGVDVGVAGSQIVGNSCISNLSTGIILSSSRNLVDNNNVHTRNGVVGIEISNTAFTNNVVMRNTVMGNGALGFDFPGVVNNVTGPIISTTTSGVITGSNPFSNLSF